MTDDDVYRGMKRALIVGVLIVIVFFVSLSAASLAGLYRSQTQDAKHISKAFSEAIGSVLDGDIRAVAASIAAVADKIRRTEDLSSDFVSRELEGVEDGDPLVAQIAIIGADGFAIDPRDVLPSGETDFRDRRFFRHHRMESGSGVFVDGPYVGRMMRRPYMTVSQRIEGPGGEFRGVIAAAIDLNAYGSALARLEAGAVDAISVFRDDGTLILRVPDPQSLSGTSFADTPLFADQTNARDAGVLLSDRPADGGDRYVGYARVGGFPLIVTASISREQAVAPWRETLIFDILKAVVVFAGIGGLAGFALHYLRRHSMVEGPYEEARAGLQAAEARHRSLFAALPAKVALIDAGGGIIEVNDEWKEFARAEEGAVNGSLEGANYLAVCDAAASEGDAVAGQVAAGLRDVLAGKLSVFDLDYPCHSPAEQRWFHLTIAPIDLGDRRGAVTMHFDVTARQLAETALAEERSRLRRLAEGIPGVVFQLALDADGQVRWNHLSERCRAVFGLSPRDALEGDGFMQTVALPDDLPAVEASVRAHLLEGRDLDLEFRARRPDGDIRCIHAVARASSGDHGCQRQSDGIFLDVTAEREAIASLAHITSHDLLTGLLNRTEFLRRLEVALQEQRYDGGGLAVHVVGIDDFGDIGDGYGMEIGDAVLRAVAERMSEVAGADATLARISGERFAILQRHPPDVTAVSALAEAVLARIGHPLDVPGQTISFSASIGIARPERRSDTASVVITGAERALRAARKSGRGLFRFDEANSGLETQTRLAMRSGLARALANGEFVLHYQPRVRLSDGAVTGCEALLRWQHPVFGMQPPAKFIPVAEQSGQIVQIGRWVMEEACRQAKEWLDSGFPDLRIAVNVSAVQVTQSDIVSTVEVVLDKTGLPTSALELEMTEAVAFDQALRGQLDRIHEIGVSIAIDDFGTGFSSLGTLRSFPVNILKIDQSFVRKAPEEASDRVVVATVIDLARGLNLMTVAEGIETIEQAVLLQSLGCDEIQGYYISMPMEAGDFRWFLETGKERVRRKLKPLYATAPHLVGGG